MADVRIVPALHPDGPYPVPCKAGVSRTFSVRVFAASTLTNQPELVCEAIDGQAADSDPATDAETGTGSDPTTWEQLTLTLETVHSTVVWCWLYNRDTSVDIKVAEIGEP
jgi:hypothetical protein